MELDERLLADISAIFKKVEYGRITFFVSPEKLNYSVETSGILAVTPLFHILCAPLATSWLKFILIGHLLALVVNCGICRVPITT